MQSAVRVSPFSDLISAELIADHTEQYTNLRHAAMRIDDDQPQPPPVTDAHDLAVYFDAVRDLDDDSSGEEYDYDDDDGRVEDEDWENAERGTSLTSRS